MSYAPVIEPFRAANRLSRQDHYSWRHYSVTGGQAFASTGTSLSVDAAVTDLDELDILFVCAGGNPALFDHARTLEALRRASRFGARLAGISGGPFILARAGLLDGYRCTIHWEHEDAFAETFPRALLERGLFVIDRDKMTCAGGLAGLDLATQLIADAQGARLSRMVSDWYIQAEQRQATRAQRSTPAQRYRVSHAGLAKVLAVLDDLAGDLHDRAELAEIAGVSIRQLERLFASQLGTSISAHGRTLRLERAKRLLVETTLSVSEVSNATNFASVSHFSRMFKEEFSFSPSKFRKAK